MSAKVLSLPEKPVREWRLAEDYLREILRAQGHDTGAIAHVCAVLRPAFLEVFVTGNIDIVARDAEDGERQVGIHVQNVMNGLLLHLARLAIENYELRREGGHHD